MTKNVKIPLIMVAIAALIGLTLALTGGEDPKAQPASSQDERLVRSDSRKLNDVPTSTVTFVEFLDFECEGCRAAFPVVEELRKTYGDRVTFVVRNFPLHANSVAAASAAEAAAEQGKFEEMYNRLFETQTEWGEKQDSQEAFFFGLAEDLGLDMDEFRKVYDDPATKEKIERDQADGKKLGVEGTPSFFLNGAKLEPTGPQDLIDSVEAALEE